MIIYQYYICDNISTLYVYVNNILKGWFNKLAEKQNINNWLSTNVKYSIWKQTLEWRFDKNNLKKTFCSKTHFCGVIPTTQRIPQTMQTTSRTLQENTTPTSNSLSSWIVLCINLRDLLVSSDGRSKSISSLHCLLNM